MSDILITACSIVALFGYAGWIEAHADRRRAERELAAIKAQRSNIVSRGNVTRALNAKAKRDQITAALRGEG